MEGEDGLAIGAEEHEVGLPASGDLLRRPDLLAVSQDSRA